MLRLRFYSRESDLSRRTEAAHAVTTHVEVRLFGAKFVSRRHVGAAGITPHNPREWDHDELRPDKI